MTFKARLLVGLVIALGLVLLVPFSLLASGAFKLFYIPSEAMQPTFDVGDRLVARMIPPSPLRRGDIVLVAAANGSIYIKRVAALSGDRIALVGGIVQLNGRPVPQRLVGEDGVAPSQYGATARRLAEQFPGEASPHEIYDMGTSPGDDFAQQTVPSGHVFLLGDNRDMSADSRFPPEEEGLGQVPLGEVRGQPYYVYWTHGRDRFGAEAGH